MAARLTQQDLKALYQIISQADLSLDMVADSHPSIARTRELLKAASALSKDLITREPDAVILGSIGGKKTAERGSEFYAKIAGMRKNRSGGRPKKA
jgi:peroxiredoxin